MPKTNVSAKTLRMTQLAILIALEAVLTLTPLGFVTIPPISITILHIPVIVGAILLGPMNGAILGGVFGLCSVFRAMMSGNPGDMLFNPAASGNAFYSLIMAILPRILLGVIAGYLYILLKKLFKTDYAALPVTAAVSTICHTVMVLGLLWLFFNGVSFSYIFEAIVALNGLVEIGLAVILVTAICKPLLTVLKKKNG